MAKLIKIPMVIKTFGNSMYPLLLDGDVLYLKKIKFSKIKVNDIVTVKNKNNYFTHRVVYKTSKYIITKGDYNHNSDGKVFFQNIVGVVKKIKRKNQFINLEEVYLLQDSLYFEEIIRLKKNFEENKIDFVFLKGLPLHLYYEKSRPKRLYADCDLLVSKMDFDKTLKLLKKLRYKRVIGQKDIIISKEKKTLENDIGEIMFYKIINGFSVIFDIHVEPVFITVRVGNRNILYPNSFLEKLSEKFLKEKDTIRIQKKDFPVLSPENLFIYLCLHIFHHNFKGAFRYELISNITKNKKLKYNEISETIRYFRLENFVYPILILLERFYKPVIPKKFLMDIKPKKTTLFFIRRYFLKINIFDDASLEGSGERFKNIFFSSPFLFKRTLIFLDVSVISAAIGTMLKRYGRIPKLP